MKFYDTPGQGKKVCKYCLKYNCARALICGNCSQPYLTKPKVDVKIETYSEPKQGRKFCSVCSKYIGAKIKKCVCGNEDFQIKPKKPEQEIKETRKYSGAGYLVHCPSGVCPKTPLSNSREDIEEWCDKVHVIGLSNNRTYTADALKYWLIQYYPGKKEQSYVDKWFDTENPIKDTANI